jgi:uncharacterized protein (DUF849 family)
LQRAAHWPKTTAGDQNTWPRTGHMIVQACINGARPATFHPALPLTAATMARDGAACVGAGAAELHLHPRGSDGMESLAPATMDATILTVRRACPGTFIGVSTGAWIEGDERRTLASIDGWGELPDHASVNLGELEAPAVMERLRQRGIGIEAGVASVADAERLAKLDSGRRVLRVLIEVSEQGVDEALTVADGIATVLARAGFGRPILLHGLDATVWQFVTLAAQRRWSTRVGLEDGSELADGEVASGNVALIAAAVEVFRRQRRP